MPLFKTREIALDWIFLTNMIWYTYFPFDINEQYCFFIIIIIGYRFTSYFQMYTVEPLYSGHSNWPVTYLSAAKRCPLRGGAQNVICCMVSFHMFFSLTKVNKKIHIPVLHFNVFQSSSMCYFILSPDFIYGNIVWKCVSPLVWNCNRLS